MSEDHSAAEVRQYLKDHGEEVKDRGKLSAEHFAKYRELRGLEESLPEGSGILEDGDYGGGVTAADFPGDDGYDEGADDPPADTAEQRPRSARRPAAERARSLWRGRGSSGGGGKSKPKSGGRSARRKQFPAVNTAPVIERIWSEMAFAVRAMPPLQRVFAAQAPMAGIILSDAAADTFVARPLQYMARAEDKLEAANAMLGPPFWTMMVMYFGGMERAPMIHEGRAVVDDTGAPVLAPVIGPDGMPIWDDRTRVMIGGLRFSLMSWIKIGQRNAEAIIERADELDELGDQADELIRWILSPKYDPRQSARDMQREAREATNSFMYRGPGAQEAERGESAAPTPAPATPGQSGGDPGAGTGWPEKAKADPRTFAFTPPDAHTASQVVPRAILPQA